MAYNISIDINEERMFNFIKKSSVGDDYTHGDYRIRVLNLEPFELRCFFYDNHGGEFNETIKVNVSKISRRIMSTSADDYSIPRRVLCYFFSKSNYIPFDEEDIKEPGEEF